MNLFRLILIVTISVSSALAAERTERQVDLQIRTNRYFAQIGDPSGDATEADGCRPSPRDCILFVAGTIPSTSERTQAAKACIGNFGAECVRWASGNLPTFGERVAGAKACRANQTTACAVFVAGHIPTTGERIASARACADADVACVKYVAGSFATFEERLAAARSCADRDDREHADD